MDFELVSIIPYGIIPIVIRLIKGIDYFDEFLNE